MEASCWVSIKGEEKPRAEDEENSSKTQRKNPENREGRTGQELRSGRRITQGTETKRNRDKRNKKTQRNNVNITIFSNAGDREKNENTGRGETEEKIERRAEIQKEITGRAGEKKGSIHTDKD